MIIDLPRFLAAEQPSWAELERMLDSWEEDADRTPSLDEVKRFHFLYQKVSADLGRISTFASEPQLKRYLESLVARAYGEVHGTRDRGRKTSLFEWFVAGFPRVFMKHRGAFALSLLATLVGMLFGGAAVALDAEAKQALVPPQFAHLLQDPADRVAKEEAATEKGIDGNEATFAGMLMTHNTRVSIFAMALGMTWAIGTVVLLFYNGVLLGFVAVDYVSAGQTVFLLGWLMPHGVIEIPAILIGGQAGIVLGRALLGRSNPLPLRRRMKAAGRDAAVLIGGVAVMLVWAGIVESFLSQHHEPVLPYWLKIAFGTAELGVLVWFLGSGGHLGRKRKKTVVPA
ncbi:MAG: stage II sporulation protein M [Chthoniobacteraceae bacterium]